MALAPMPMTATRSPRRSWSWSQRAEWNAVPSKSSSPGMSGMFGRFSCPRPDTTTSATTRSPSARVSSQLWSVSLQVADGHLGTEAQVRLQLVCVHQRLEVAEDLWLLGELAGPVGLRGEREAVQVRGHVTGRSWIGVVAPGAAHAVGSFVDGEAVDPCVLQLHGHAQPRRPGTQDGHPRRARAAIIPEMFRSNCTAAHRHPRTRPDRRDRTALPAAADRSAGTWSGRSPGSRRQRQGEQMSTVDLTLSEFESTVTAEGIVLVDFWASLVRPVPLVRPGVRGRLRGAPRRSPSRRSTPRPSRSWPEVWGSSPSRP